MALSMSVTSLAAVVVLVRSLAMHGSSKRLSVVRALTTMSFSSIGSGSGSGIVSGSGSGSGSGSRGGSSCGSPTATYECSGAFAVHTTHTSASTSTSQCHYHGNDNLPFKHPAHWTQKGRLPPRFSPSGSSARVAMPTVVGVGVVDAYHTHPHTPALTRAQTCIADQCDVV